MATLCKPDPLLSRAHELLEKSCPVKGPSLWLKPPSGLPRPHHSDSRFWHPWFPEHQALLSQGWKASEGVTKWPQVLLYGGKQKEENLLLLDYAAGRLEENGEVLFLTPNDYGSKSYQKPLGSKFESLAYESGRKSRLYKLRGPKTPSRLEVPCPLRQASPPFWSCPGLFSWEKPDRGSVILAKFLRERALKQPVADLGGGWGYLAASLPQDCKVHVFEADRRGVEACQKNLEGRHAQVFWADVTDLKVDKPFATVITNPPFHSGKKSDPILGGAFAATAHKILKPGGQLFLVGNSHLPYPKILKSFFSEVEVLVRKDGFAIVRALK